MCCLLVFVCFYNRNYMGWQFNLSTPTEPVSLHPNRGKFIKIFRYMIRVGGELKIPDRIRVDITPLQYPEIFLCINFTFRTRISPCVSIIGTQAEKWIKNLERIEFGRYFNRYYQGKMIKVVSEHSSRAPPPHISASLQLCGGSASGAFLQENWGSLPSLRDQLYTPLSTISLNSNRSSRNQQFI